MLQIPVELPTATDPAASYDIYLVFKPMDGASIMIVSGVQVQLEAASPTK